MTAPSGHRRWPPELPASAAVCRAAQRAVLRVLVEEQCDAPAARTVLESLGLARRIDPNCPEGTSSTGLLWDAGGALTRPDGHTGRGSHG